jgi:AcrR family transcriptional regulator
MNDSASAPDKSDDDVLSVGFDAGVRFDIHLEKKSRDRALGKRDRTRCLVFSSVARQLLDSPAKRPSIEVVMDETGLSRGTFYNYFTDIDECVVLLISGFFKALWNRGSFSASGLPHRPKFDPVHEANLWYCAAYETNAGLFAVYSQVATNTPELLRMREQMNADWVDRVLAASAKRRGRPYKGAEEAAFKGQMRLLISMSIEALRERNIHCDPLLLKSFPDVESLARGLTDMWHTTISKYETGSEHRR